MSHREATLLVVLLTIHWLIVLFAPRPPRWLLGRWPLTGNPVRRGTAAIWLSVALVAAIAQLSAS